MFRLLNVWTYTTTGATNIVQLPLAFVRSGDVNINYGSMDYVGQLGYGRSRTPYSTTHAYNLRYDATTVSPSSNSNRYYGFPLRCQCPLPPLDITRVEAAEGETDVTIVAIGWTDVRSVEGEAARAGRRASRTRPEIAVAADVSDITIVEADNPATDKSQKPSFS